MPTDKISCLSRDTNLLYRRCSLLSFLMFVVFAISSSLYSIYLTLHVFCLYPTLVVFFVRSEGLSPFVAFVVLLSW
jgi:hypothetical protein